MSDSAANSTATLSSFTRRFALPHWPWYLGGFVALAVTNLVALEIPQLAKAIVNALADGRQLSTYGDVALIIMGLGALQMIVRAVSRIFIFWPARQLEANLKQHLFDKVLRLPYDFFLTRGMGDLISRVTGDTNHVRVFFAFGILQVANMVFLIAFTVSKMLSVNPSLTVACLTPLVIMFVITRFVMPKMHRVSRQNQDAVGRLTNRVTEAFTNIHVVKTNSAERAFAERCKLESEEVFKSNMQLVIIRTVLFPLMTCLAGLSQLVVLAFGGYLVLAQKITVGDILAFNVYIALLTFPLTAIGIILAVYQRAKTALERIDDIESKETESGEVESTKGGATAGAKIPSPRSDVPLLEIRSLSYSYETDDGDRSCLEHISLVVNRGEKVGLFGEIGSGKTTLFNLIVRLTPPPENSILLEGQDVCALSPEEVRARIGYALQSAHLFSDTVIANIGFGLTKSSVELQAAAALAAVSEDVAHFPDQWETQVGEKGLRLSGGQKQRLALARVLARPHELLLLDDVFSAVDQTTEMQLIDNLFSTGVAALIASHRPSVLQRCDRVYFLEKGRLIEKPVGFRLPAS